ncbi:carotenoid 1,2-hydratase [Massilia sp. YIM B02763]|uniref:lipocalin-like domain-containing protein n=1 Tax=Massilia sp. YIM B02763 TaxID=3050130 RepID=UPI0025B69B20|nr:carotenoid 1,2-hydratase [Massilia sp. YIM B02763]MDN4054226.1 carotenoid 1,2-hydratase [Massilia sp. YIM B02763]
MRILRSLLLLLALAANALAAPPAFAPVVPGRALAFPADFGAHPDHRTEWWYVTGWLRTPDGKPLGFQVTFFRSRSEHDPANPSAFAPTQLIIGHAALSDPALGHLVHDQRSARAGFGLAYAQTGDTDVKLDDWSMRRGADGRYRVVVRSGELSYTLTLTPTQKPMLQGENGYSRKGRQPDHASYYYSEPHLRVDGNVAWAGSKGRSQAVTGTAWLDHEWSSQVLDPDAAGWDWTGINLDDGGALMAFRIRSKSGATLWAHAALRDAQGRVTQYGPDQVRFAPQKTWTSPRTNATYPVAAVLTLDGSAWRIDALQADQELDSRRSTGAVYWEGAVTASRDGRPVGRGYLELTGYVAAMKL